MSPVRRIAAGILPLACAALSAAELPLGVVVQTDAEAVVARFDAAARILPGQVLALYGPGAVVRHPLTGKIVSEQRRLLAKGQALAVQDGQVRLRLIWRDGEAVPAAGWDVVPLPGEAAPNAPPALTAPIPALTAAPGATIPLRLPIADPDGDALSFSWLLVGPAGRTGRLDARQGARPENMWTAPAFPGQTQATLVVTALDASGQSLSVEVPLATAGADDPRRPRKAFTGLGTGQEPAWKAIDRCDDGGWIGVDDGGQVRRVTSSWQQVPVPALAEVRRPVAAALRNQEIFVLDSSRAAVLVFAEGGQPRRTLAGLSEPTDLAVAADGGVFVADHRAGGVMVFDASGRFRARIGRTGTDDGFALLQRIVLTPGGELVALDAGTRRLHRFDAALRRLDAWTITGDPKNPPVDLAWHPRGILVLLGDGSVQLYAGKGAVAETWKPAAAAGLADLPAAAVALAADPGGDVITVGGDGSSARYAFDGRLHGVRGPDLLRSFGRCAADGSGRLIALDADYGILVVHDAEGWRTAQAGGRIKAGGPFGSAGAMAVSPDGGAIAVLDLDRDVVVRLDGRDPRKPPLVFAGSGDNPGQLRHPIGIAIDEAGRSYVLDDSLYRVSVYDHAGQFLFSFGEVGAAPHQFDEPILVAVAPSGDAAYVFDEDRYEVKKFALDHQAKAGRHVVTAGGKGSDPGQFRGPVAMQVDRLGLLHILDASRGDWQILDLRGQSLLAVAARKIEDFNRAATTLAVSADGTAWFAGGGAVVGVR